MKLILLTKSKRKLENVLFTFPISYTNEFTAQTFTFDCCVYEEKADVYPLLDYYCELFYNKESFARFKIILSVAEKRIANRHISKEYFEECITETFERFQGKSILKRFVGSLDSFF